MTDLNKPRCTCNDEFGNADIVGLENVMQDICTNLSFEDMNRLTAALNRFRDVEVEIESGELVQVVHGEWILITAPKKYAGGIVCSNCRKSTDWQYNYCPNCGAKMDLEGGK